MRRRLVVLVAVLVTTAIAVPAAFAQVTPADVAEARDRMRAVTADLEGRVELYDAAVVREVDLRERLDALLIDLTDREHRLVLARAAAKERVADMYMGAGTSSGATSFLGVEDFSMVPARLAYLDTVAATDREIVNQLEAARQGYLRQQALLEETVTEQESLSAEMESLISEIYTELEDANAEYQEVKAAFEAQEVERLRREEEERIRRERELFFATSTTTTVPPPTTTTTAPPTTTTTSGVTTTTVGSTTTTTSGDGSTTTTTVGGTTTTTTVSDTTTTTSGDGSTTTTEPPTTTTTQPTTTTTRPPAVSQACPVDGAVTFRDSWGESRPGGRSHTGTDMMAATGTPLVSIESGYIWSPNWHYDGGIGLYIRGDSGNMWYYAHLDRYASGVADGLRVSAGQLVGYVGTTGNASVPHLHLGYLLGGVTYTNPYPLVAALCR